ncbi:MAG TPA: hypothetical protein EYQ20_09715 [candidate division Zixibacteria bacterium]|nr:hypothetical protein [candidate division Zixibacteria bacterium]
MAVRITPENISSTIEFLRSSWQEVYPQDTFAFSFLDDDFNRQYQTEESRGDIFRSVLLVAVFITCLGLLGLASFTAEQRTKGIGVRKVLGAPVGSIIVMLSKAFTKLVLLAVAITLLTVGYQAIKAALTNPVTALQYE